MVRENSTNYRAGHDYIFRKTTLQRKLTDLHEESRGNFGENTELMDTITNIAGNRGYSHEKRVELIRKRVEAAEAPLSMGEEKYVEGVMEIHMGYLTGTKKTKGGIRLAREIKNREAVYNSAMQVYDALPSYQVAATRGELEERVEDDERDEVMILPDEPRRSRKRRWGWAAGIGAAAACVIAAIGLGASSDKQDAKARADAAFFGGGRAAVTAKDTTRRPRLPGAGMLAVGYNGGLNSRTGYAAPTDGSGYGGAGGDGDDDDDTLADASGAVPASQPAASQPHRGGEGIGGQAIGGGRGPGGDDDHGVAGSQPHRGVPIAQYNDLQRQLAEAQQRLRDYEGKLKAGKERESRLGERLKRAGEPDAKVRVEARKGMVTQRAYDQVRGQNRKLVERIADYERQVAGLQGEVKKRGQPDDQVRAEARKGMVPQGDLETAQTESRGLRAKLKAAAGRLADATKRILGYETRDRERASKEKQKQAEIDKGIIEGKQIDYVMRHLELPSFPLTRATVNTKTGVMSDVTTVSLIGDSFRMVDERREIDDLARVIGDIYKPKRVNARAWDNMIRAIGGDNSPVGDLNPLSDDLEWNRDDDTDPTNFDAMTQFANAHHNSRTHPTNGVPPGVVVYENPKNPDEVIAIGSHEQIKSLRRPAK